MAGQEIKWISGPIKASLNEPKRGPIAEIEIPAGYRLTDAANARGLLRRMGNPVPAGLLGILAPDSGKWWVVLSFSDLGYLKDVDQERIDKAAILKQVLQKVKRQNADRKKAGLPPIESVDWNMAPVFDAENHSLEWAVQAVTASGSVVNRTLRILGRYGVLDATAVQGTTDPVPLKALMDNVTFKKGQRYADYQPGDKVSNIGLVGLIINEPKPAEDEMKIASGGGTILWIGSALIGGLIVTVGILLSNRKHHHRRHRKTPAAATAETQLEPAAVGETQPEPAAAVPANDADDAGDVNGERRRRARSSNNHHGSRRRRAFNYQKFYSEMIMQVSSRAYKLNDSALNERIMASRRLEVQPASRYEEAVPNQLLLSVHSELISNQKNFIEEQRRLMLQQTKLIEEKSKLIEEKNRLLARQSEMMESSLL